MSEPTGAKPSEGAAQVDLTKYVPKDEHEKALNTAKELETKLEEAKLSLLDPEYISFLESKKGKAVAKKVDSALSKISEEDIDKMSSKELLDLAVEKAKETILGEVSSVYDDQLKRMGATLSDVLAILELQDVEKRHKDFGDYRDDTRKILETSATPLTIEQAYRLAKQAAIEKDPSKATAKAKNDSEASSEKPSGTVAKDTMAKTSFKDKVEAGEDAWNRTVGADKDIL